MSSREGSDGNIMFIDSVFGEIYENVISLQPSTTREVQKRHAAASCFTRVNNNNECGLLSMLHFVFYFAKGES